MKKPKRSPTREVPPTWAAQKTKLAQSGRRLQLRREVRDETGARTSTKNAKYSTSGKTPKSVREYFAGSSDKATGAVNQSRSEAPQISQSETEVTAAR